MNKQQCIIIGGGLSGLSAAYYARQAGQQVLLLESGKRLGGALHSQDMGEDFWLELGGHTAFNSYGNLLDIMEQNQQLPRLRKRDNQRFFLWRDNKRRCILGDLCFLSLFGSLLKPGKPKKQGHTVEEYYSALFGKKNYNAVFKHAFSAVISQPAGKFPADLLFRKKPRRKDVQRSFVLPKGMQEITDAMAVGLDYRLEQDIQRVTYQDGEGFTIELANSEPLHAEKLILATPAPVSAKLLAESFPALSGLVGEVENVEVETVAVRVAADATDIKEFAGLIASDEAFYSAVSRDTLKDPNWRGFSFHFQPGKESEEQKRATICRVLGVQPEQIQAEVSKINVLPALRMGHHDRVAKIDRVLTDSPLGLSGNYFLGVSMEDCVSRSKREAERLFA